MKHKWSWFSKLTVTAVVSLCLAGVMLMSFVLFIATALGSMLEIADKAPDTLIEDVTDSDDDSDTDIVDDNFYDDLAKKLAYIDMESLCNAAPELIELGLLNDYIPNGWDAYSYLETYKLFSEICAREEINPHDAAVKITPEILFGMWYSEKGFSPKNYADAMFYGSVPTFTKGTGYLTWEDYTGDDYIGAFAQAKSLTAGISQPGDSVSYTVSYIYISKEENPSLADSMRAIRLKPYSLDSIEYMSPDYSGTATADVVRESIKCGYLPTAAGARDVSEECRPNGRFLPDSAYLAAYTLRTRLDPAKLAAGIYSSQNMREYFDLSKLTSEQSQDLELAQLAIAIEGNSANTWFRTTYTPQELGQTDSNGGIKSNGFVPLVYMSIAAIDNASFYAIDALAEDKQKSLLTAGAAYIDGRLLLGAYDDTADKNWGGYVTAGYVIQNAVDTIPSLAGESVALLAKIEQNFDELPKELQEGYYSITSSPDPNSYVFNNIRDIESVKVRLNCGDSLAYEILQCSFYGVRSISGGHYMMKRVRTVVDKAYSKYGRAMTDPSDTEDKPTADLAGVQKVIPDEYLGTAANLTLEQIRDSNYYNTQGSSLFYNALEYIPEIDTLLANKGLAWKSSLAERGKVAMFPIAFKENTAQTTYSGGIGLGTYSNHSGLDILDYSRNRIKTGAAICAADSGVVVYVGIRNSYAANSLGNCIMLYHGNGYYTTYAHFAYFAQGIHLGDFVPAGTILGGAGSTGTSYGEHLHFEAFRHLNPSTYTLNEIRAGYAKAYKTAPYLADYIRKSTVIVNESEFYDNFMNTGEYYILTPYPKNYYVY